MASTDKAFTGSIPEVYERHLVPLIFEPYARDIAVEVARLAPRTILETAAGTGVVTRALVAALPATARLVATDLNEAMLAIARDHDARKRTVEWRLADALALPFTDQTFDAVVCQFGVMFFPDKLRGFGEARRVLTPTGSFVFSVWDEIGANEFADAVTEALAELYPDDPPRFLARTPHGYADTVRIEADLKAAGFSGVTSRVVAHVSRSATPYETAMAFCQGTPLRSEITARDATGLAHATQRIAGALAMRFGRELIQGRLRAIMFTATL